MENSNVIELLETAREYVRKYHLEFYPVSDRGGLSPEVARKQQKYFNCVGFINECQQLAGEYSRYITEEV